MSKIDTIISDEDIHAFVDGQLDEERTAAFIERMTSDPELRATVEQYQQQNSLLHESYDPILEEPVPVGLGLNKSRHSFNYGWNIAAGVCLLFIGGIVGWQLNGAQKQTQSLISDLATPAMLAHVVYTPEVKHPVEVGAAEQQHLTRWLSKRLDSAVSTPDLSSFGFELMGGRLLPGKQGPAAQFMYEDKQGERMTLYVRRKQNAEQNTAFRFEQGRNTNAFYWIDGDLGYVLSGSTSRQQLLQIANRVYHQLGMQ